MQKMIQDKLNTLKQLSDSPELSKYLGKVGEQGRIIGILKFYKDKYPEFPSSIFDKIMEEIETEKNVE